MFGDGTSDFHGVDQLQLATGKLPVAVQVDGIDGRRFGLLFYVDDCQHRSGSLPTRRFSREKRKADELGRVDLTAGGYMVG